MSTGQKCFPLSWDDSHFYLFVSSNLSSVVSLTDFLMKRFIPLKRRHSTCKQEWCCERENKSGLNYKTRNNLQDIKKFGTSLGSPVVEILQPPLRRVWVQFLLWGLDPTCCGVWPPKKIRSNLKSVFCCSVAVMSNSLRPHGLQHARLSLSFTNSQSLLRLMSIESVMPSNHLILCHPLLLLPSVFPSIRIFSNESVLWISWPKDWSFSFSISPSDEYSGLISFRTDWFDLLAAQGILKSLL